MNKIRNFNQTLTWFLSPKSLYLDEEGPWVVEMIAENLSCLYQNLPILKVRKEKELIEIQELNNKDYIKTDSQYLKPVLDLKNYVKKNFSQDLYDFIIHGSISSLDYSMGWSDLDTYVILKSNTINNPRELIETRKKLLKVPEFLHQIDPLQHHGLIYATEFDLSSFFTHCLPVEVLKESKSLFKDSHLEVKQYRSKEETKYFLKKKLEFFKDCYENKAMFHHPLNGVYLLEDFKETNAMYQMKYFLSVLMSMPVFFLDALGQASYKKDSFKKAKPYFGKEWEIIEISSEIRQQWQHNERHPYLGNEIPGWLINKLGKDYFSRAYNISKKMYELLDKKI